MVDWGKAGEKNLMTRIRCRCDRDYGAGLSAEGEVGEGWGRGGMGNVAEGETKSWRC